MKTDEQNDDEADSLPPSIEERGRSLRWPITVILGFGFGALMLAAVASVLFLGISGARQNTATLLRDKAELTLSSMNARIEAHLKPVEHQIAYLATRIAREHVDLDDREAIGRFLSGALAATPQVAGLAFMRPDASLWRVDREVPTVYHENWADNSAAVEALEEARNATTSRWAPPVWTPLQRQAVLTYRTPVHGADGFLGLLVAGITVDELSRQVARVSEDLNQTVFILYDFETVLAHPAIAAGRVELAAGKPLPRIDEVGDPVLANIWAEEREPLTAVAQLSRGQGHIVQVNGADQVYIYRDLRLYGQRPWIVGLHLPADAASEEILRLRNMAIGGGVLLIVFMLATIAIGRWLSAPVTRLAVAAGRVRDFDLATIDRLQPSRVREFDDAARAFNSMVVGLKWFETYLPRKLVSRLIAGGEFRHPPSEERVVTVLFTDIAGFSGFAEGKSAREVARFLNLHFTLVGQCIEDQDGTIDKYIGDSVMAFWGAPSDQPDQALRACQAAMATAAALEAENADRAEREEPPVRMRIGVHTGRAIVGNIGSSGRLNYTLVGDAVNIAQRLEQLGKEVRAESDAIVLISEATAKELRGHPIPLSDEGEWHLRGRGEKVRVFQIVSGISADCRFRPATR